MVDDESHTGPSPDEASQAEPAQTEPAQVEQAASSQAAPPLAVAAPAVSRRTIGIALGLVAVVGVIVMDVVFIVNGAETRGPPLAPSAEALASAPLPSASATEAIFTEPPAPEPEPEPPHAEEPAKPSHEHHSAPGTVQEAAARSCSTAVVDGLSRQIIRQSRCIDPGAFVAVPRRSNLVTKSNVFLYMEAPARDHLLKALDANKKLTMTVNSSLRTVAQQYLLWHWYANRRCGIHLATPPGDSNHETGLALDIAEAPSWRPALKAQDFHWLGAIDAMHFDYKGPDAVSHASVDVKAFQQLWNANHADDRIAENGRFTPETEQRLKKAPAAGFPHAPHCGH